MSADIEAIAREGLALSERATKGPWTVEPRTVGSVTWDGVLRNAAGDPIASVLASGWDKATAKAHFALIAHAGTHYATLCQAMLSRGQAQAWVTVTDDPRTWPPESDEPILCVRQLSARPRLDGKPTRSGYRRFSQRARLLRYTASVDASRGRSFRWMHWPAPATPEKR